MIGKRMFKRHSICQRVVSTVLSAILAVTSFSSMGIVVGRAEEVSGGSSGSAAVNYGLMENIQDGTILHCFDWKYEDIKAELPNIAAAGFTAVQTSPAQPGGKNDPDAESGTWWWLYQPLSFHIGKNYLGTPEELQDLCTEAHKYGIKVIVDIVANHLAGDHTYIQEELKNEEYWRPYHDYKYNEKTGVDDRKDPYWKDKDSRYITTHKALGMPDIVSENAYVQQCVANYITELKSVGVDGLRWDTLKHIQVPIENCAFFTTAIEACNGMYNYGESLGDPGAGNETDNRTLMQEYTSLMSVTDDVYGNNIRKAFAAGNMPDNLLGNWINRGVSADKLVYWAESHDTWSNAEDGNGDSTNVPQSVIDRVYAVVASRSGATSLYFSRPSEKKKNYILAGVKGSTHFTSPEVAEVNHFHNAFNGQSEYISSLNNIVYIERGTKGVVITKIDGAGNVKLNANRMVDGTYTDHVSGNTFTVQNGVISGTVNDTGIAVVYNENDVEEGPFETVPSKVYFDSSGWSTDGAFNHFAMYLWKGGTNTWVSMTDTNNDGIYEADMPAGDWENVIFCSMNNEKNEWQYCELQTVDITIKKIGDNIFRITGLNDGKHTGKWLPHIFASQSPELDRDGIFYATATFSNCRICGKSHVYPVEIEGTPNDDNTITYTFSFIVNGNNSYSGTFKLNAKKISLEPNDNWKQDNARFAVYLWDESNHNAWADLTDSDGDGVYSVLIPVDTWTNAIFCRMNGSTTANNWDNKWNATDDLTIPASNTPVYKLEEATNYWDGCIGSWSDPNCTHSFNPQPLWIWNGVSSATATFTCSVCGATETQNANITTSTNDEYIIYTASVVHNGVTYTDTRTVDRTEEPVVYLDLNQMTSWLNDEARFAIRIKNETTENEAWVDMADPDSDNIYYAKIPDGTWTSIIFCRMNGSTTENNWDNRLYNTLKQSDFLQLGNRFTITSGSGYEYTGTWNNYTHEHNYVQTGWTWEDDYSSATLSVICTVCGRTRNYDSEVTSSFENDVITYTASANINGVTYTDTVSVSDNMSEFLLKCEAYKTLSDEQKKIYRELLSFARSVVRGEQSGSSFGFIPNIKKTWTFAELDLDSSANNQAAYNAINRKVGSELQKVFYALLADCPYEFYWYAKTVGYSYGLSSAALSRSSDAITITNEPSLNITMAVSEHYQGDTTTSFNKTAINTVKRNITAVAKAIVDQYANVSDYEKLKAYAQLICSFTDYNDDAAALTSVGYDIDPWQLVYVFDGDDTTKVVCEGYSKAFKYLCDLTEFSSTLIKCYLVSGLLNTDDGGHMWNIVTMDDGKNYLVDVTNSDGNRNYDAFLLNGGTLNSNGWYPISSRNSSSDVLYYKYYTETEGFWGNDILTLSSTNYTQTVTTHTVTWKNYDGTVLETDTNVVSGTMPSYDGTTPTKPADAQYTYTFAGWTPTVSAVTGDVTYTATYTSSLREYTITWKMDDGTVIDTTTVAYGETPTHAAPAKSLSGTAQYHYYYEFTGWDRDLAAVDGDAEYTAQFEQREMVYYLVGTINNWTQSDDYAFVFNYDDSNVIEYKLLNVSLSKNDQLKAKSNKDKWFPSGGDGENYIVPADGTYNIYLRPNASGADDWHRSVLYFENVTQYTVTFDSDGGSSVAEQTVTYGNKATQPDAPTKSGYTFSGWYIGDTDDEFDFDTPVTDNITLTAHWAENTVEIAYTDINGNKTVIDAAAGVASFDKSKLSIPPSPYLDGYDLNGWTVNGSVINNYDSVIDAVESNVRNNQAVSIKPNYERKTINYSIDVVDGTLDNGLKTATYRLSDLIRVTADDKSTENKVFDHWDVSYNDGATSVMVSYNNTYYLLMPSQNIRITAVFINSGAQQTQRSATAYIENVTKPADNKLAFVAIINVPEDCTIKTLGVVATNDDAIGTNLSSDSIVQTEGKKLFITERTSTKKAVKYTWTKGNVADDETWYVRPYVVCENADNSSTTIYGDLVQKKLSDVQ